MGDKLQELTERLYKDGVEKARHDAALILEEAEKRKSELIAKAEAEAREILEKGRLEATAVKSRMESELALAARQAESALKQHIVTLITGDILSSEVTDSLNDGKLLTALISAATEEWARSGSIPEVSLVLSGKQKDQFESSFRSVLKDRLDQGLNVRFSDRMKDGFRIESNNGDYVLSFSGEDFQEYFRSFLKEKTRTVLFGEN